jgi:two-component system sensor histidine kinase AlgZ
MNIYNPSDFVFSSKYRVWRHAVFWIAQDIFFALVYINLHGVWMQLSLGMLWIPVRMLYCYRLMYWVLPQYLLKGKYTQFSFIILLWVIAGYFLNYLFRAYFYIPIQKYMHLSNIVDDPWMPGSFLIMLTVAGFTCMIVLFKHWFKKQQEWMQAEKEKVTAELQLLKAQVHPHFLFNTLNNIYSFSLENSPKTPGLILKLSSLLSYMLYDCKGEQVLLEKEIEVMKDYIGLEKERYGNKIEISLSIEGDIKDKCIAPLLLLPFLENAFKHGTSEQLEKPWLSMDIAVKQNIMKCKIANSKNQFVPVCENGIGIQNVKKRLQFLYPGKYELKINDEGEFFVVFLLFELMNKKIDISTTSIVTTQVTQIAAP